MNQVDAQGYTDKIYSIIICPAFQSDSSVLLTCATISKNKHEL